LDYNSPAFLKYLSVTKVERTDRFRAEAVIDGLGADEVRGKRFLLPRAAKAREILPEKIEEMGGRIDVVTVYETIRPTGKREEVRDLLKRGGISCITFTSSSTVQNFAEMFPEDDLPSLVEKASIACIGPITAQTAREHGLEVNIMPEEYTTEALTAEVVEYFSRS
jgi:uroporphyrinogen III methyltransferase/synthase